jgi:hypothetical protein
VCVCVCLCLYVCVYSTTKDGGSLCDLLWSMQNIEQEREKKREKGEGREREREAQDRIKSSSTLSSSLITIHFFDYINARQKKTRPRKCRQTAQMENNDVTDQAKKDETLFDNV